MAAAASAALAALATAAAAAAAAATRWRPASMTAYTAAAAAPTTVPMIPRRWTTSRSTTRPSGPAAAAAAAATRAAAAGRGRGRARGGGRGGGAAGGGGPRAAAAAAAAAAARAEPIRLRRGWPGRGRWRQGRRVRLALAGATKTYGDDGSAPAAADEDALPALEGNHGHGGGGGGAHGLTPLGPIRNPPKRRAWLSEQQEKEALESVRFPPSAASGLLKQLADFNPSGSGDFAKNALLPNEHDAKERGETWRLPEGVAADMLAAKRRRRARRRRRRRRRCDGSLWGPEDRGLAVPNVRSAQPPRQQQQQQQQQKAAVAAARPHGPAGLASLGAPAAALGGARLGRGDVDGLGGGDCLRRDISLAAVDVLAGSTPTPAQCRSTFRRGPGRWAAASYRTARGGARRRLTVLGRPGAPNGLSRPGSFVEGGEAPMTRETRRGRRAAGWGGAAAARPRHPPLPPPSPTNRLRDARSLCLAHVSNDGRVAAGIVCM